MVLAAASGWGGWSFGLWWGTPLTRAIRSLERGAVLERSRGAHELGELRDPRGLGPLLRALADPVDAVRVNAAWALGRLGDPRAAGALREAVKDSSPEVRMQADMALKELGSEARR